MAALVVVAAFSVEAFVQTLGPPVLRARWTEGEGPMERWSVKDKLKAIGKAVGVAVDYGKSPWSDIKSLLEARDDLAHAKPATQLVTSTIKVPPDGKLPADLIGPLVAQKYRPLHDLAELERVANLIDDALLPMWTGAGNPASTFGIHGTSSYVVSI
jgi:hypothetical protein